MQEHESRVIVEKEELEEKLSKLSGFIMSDAYDGLDAYEMGLLARQAVTMITYSKILEARIFNFKSCAQLPG